MYDKLVDIQLYRDYRSGFLIISECWAGNDIQFEWWKFFYNCRIDKYFCKAAFLHANKLTFCITHLWTIYTRKHSLFFLKIFHGITLEAFRININFHSNCRKVLYVDRDYTSWLFHRCWDVNSFLPGGPSLGRPDWSNGISISS